ncbi:nucleotide-binding domain-containing protein [Astrocystis sublimbata]|nr:nucleotide-binding domain-containing protein [Astrocystis sublimbata]
MSTIVVIGAGVTGLSCALRIQEAGHSVTIVAKDLPSGFEIIDSATQINFTSPWGGAHNRFILPKPGAAPDSQEAREHEMALLTWEAMRSLHDRHPEAGITFLKAYDYFDAPGPIENTLTEERARNELGMKEFRFHTKEELPEGVKVGYEYQTWCINPMVYCAFLLRRFAYRGGKIVRKEIRDPQEVFEMRDLGPCDVLINASGIGFGDNDVFITTGQTCLVANHCPISISRIDAEGKFTFNIPRGFEGGTIVGGTKIPNYWNPNPSLEVRGQLLTRFAATCPDILGPDGKYTVIRDIVGRRPTRRGGMRLETEIAQGNKCIIHAYGLGGRGYELSWGVAHRVSELLASQTRSADISLNRRQSKM